MNPQPVTTVSSPRNPRARRWRWAVVAVTAALALVAGSGAVSASPSAVPAAPTPTPTPAVPTAPTPTPAAVQAALDRVVADGVPGTIALGRDGQRVWTATSGIRDIRTKAPIRATDRFRIASNTKSFVAAVILQLVAEGRLRLTDSVERWLPGLVPNGSAITLRHLLNHTSGLYNYTENPRVLEPHATNPAHYWTPRQLVGFATERPPLFPPGQKFSYNNTGYILLGLVIEAVTKRGASAEIHRRLIAPLGLRDTYFPLRDPHIVGPHTRGYITNLPPETSPEPTVDSTVLSPSVVWTAGAIVSTVSDLGRFHRALVTGRLLRPAQMREMMTTVPAEGYDYGLGVYRMQTPCGSAWGHDGSFAGYLSFSLVSPDGARQAVLVLNTNQILTEQAILDTLAALGTVFCGRPAQPATTPQIPDQLRSHRGTLTPAL